MPAKTTPSFVTEIPLKATASQEVALNKRFNAARQVYNACLGEGLRRFDLMRESKAWQKARKMPKGGKKSKSTATKQQAKDRSKAFNGCWLDFDLQGKYSLQSFAQQFSQSWLGNHLGSQLIKVIATTAFVWIKEYAFNANRGRPKFKSFGRFNSVETGYTGKEFLFEQIDGKYIVSWSIGKLWDFELGKFGKKGSVIQLETIIDFEDPVLRHGLSCRVKYVRLVRRNLNGRIRFYAQLVCEGKPYQRFKLGSGTVGLDIGPSTIAVVSSSEAFLDLFCRQLVDCQKEIRLLQRQIDRQRREANPGNYESDRWVKKPGRKNAILKKGKVIKGSRKWVKSNRQKENEAKLRELRRKETEYRKSLHGQLVNQILQMGDTVNLERLSYVAFQKLWGKSVGKRAPGMFVAKLRRKVEDAGGLVNEFSTYFTKFSQLDHKTGEFKKKSLSQRWHIFDDGEVVQRDLYSAFLAICLEDGKFSAALADKQWAGVGSLLHAALDDLQNSEWDGVKHPSSFGLKRIRAKQRQRGSRVTSNEGS